MGDEYPSPGGGQNSQQAWQQAAGKHVPHIPALAKPQPPAITPFPAHVHRSGHFSVERSKLSSVVKNMNQDYTQLLQDAASFTGGGASCDGTGDWETAANFGSNAYNAYMGITGYFQVLNSNYEDSMQRLHKSVGRYLDADADTQARIPNANHPS